MKFSFTDFLPSLKSAVPIFDRDDLTRVPPTRREPCRSQRAARFGTAYARLSAGVKLDTRRLLQPLTVLCLSISGCMWSLCLAGESSPEQDKTIYVIGVLLQRELAVFNLTPAELEVVKAGMTDQALNRPLQADLQAYAPKIQEFQRSRAAAVLAAEQRAGETYMKQALKQKKTKKTASGLVISTLKAGSGAAPKSTDRVKVNYRGTLLDGTEFDSSLKRGVPASFALDKMIPCWTEALQLMKVGGKTRLVCPASLAYAERGQPPLIKPGATLVFEVELLSIEK